MKVEELQQENNQLKAQMFGLSAHLKLAEEKLQEAQTQIQNLIIRNNDLASEVRHLTMLVRTANSNRDDSRNY
jgi:chromosome segregation ATPase